MEEILKKYSILKNKNVSRETILEFENFIFILKKRNEDINIISKESAKNIVIRERHIIDCAQIIDFIDLNSNKITDIGSGGGFPGIIVAIIMKNLQSSAKVYLHEKRHKSKFI